MSDVIKDENGSGIGLGIRKFPDETWLEAALRYARPYGLEAEVRQHYDACVGAGDDEAEAAFQACCEWDVAALYENGEVAH